jgi:alanyl-tRNA synthetase
MTTIITIMQAQRDLAGVRNRQLTAAVDAGIAGAMQKMRDAADAGTDVCVLTVDIGCDPKGIKRAMNTLSKAAPGMAFMCLSAGQAEDKLLCFSFVPEGHAQAQGPALKANEWLSATLKACGGRGGGKANMAQGSAAGAEQLTAAEKAAHAFLAAR